MKLRFRTTQLTLFLAVLLPVVVVLGLTGYLAVRYTGEELAGQLLEQTSSRIDEEIEKVLNEAVEETRLSRALMESGRLASTNFPDLVRFWEQVLHVRRELTSIFIALEADGQCVGVSRLVEGMSVWQLTSQAGHAQRLEQFAVADYPDRPNHVQEDSPYDIRSRPWYRLAKAAGTGAWADCYLFLGLDGTNDVMGVTYAEPVRDAAGKLQAIVSADFSLTQLSEFLRELRVGDRGYAFVVELRDDGTRAVIAHPHAKILTRATESGPALIPVDQSPDPHVVAAVNAAGPLLNAPAAGIPLRFEHHDIPFVGVARRIGGRDTPPWQIFIVLPEEDLFSHVERITTLSTLLAVGSVAVVILFGMYLSSQVARPLERLAEETEAVGRFDLSPRPLPESVVLEVDRLSTATGNMKTSLRSFRKFVPADVVRSLVASRQEAIFGGERRCVTTMFSDIVSFTTTAEGLSPEDLVAHLRRYLSVVSDAIATEEGTVDKFIGDAVMALWGAPPLVENHALAACRAALAVEARLEEHRVEWARLGLPEFRARYGINTGDVIVGNIGSDTRLSYTAIGDAVNLASRLEGLNKEYGTTILLSEATRVMAGTAIVARPLDWVSVKGKTVATPVFELLGLVHATSPERVALAERFEHILRTYRQSRFGEAVSLCEQVLQDHPQDAATLRLRARCQTLAANPPGHDWDGTFQALEK